MSTEPHQLDRAPTYKRITLLAIPIMIANAAQPLLGLADTAILGHFGAETDLGGIALGTLIFSFVYWGFGFLRMGTTGFVAQAYGAQDEEGVRATVGRSLLLALGLGVALIALQKLIGWTAGFLLSGSEAVWETAIIYFETRIWGAPATLANFALFGTLIGLGKTRLLLFLQLLLNGVNLGLNLWFVIGLGLGVQGIAMGTVIAEILCVVVGLAIVLPSIRPSTVDAPFWPRARIMEWAAWKRTMMTNTDIMWRTLFILAGFGWFTKQSAILGDDILAANHILIQITTFAAFFLDGFAFVVEALIGQTLGAGRADLFRTTLFRSTVLSGGTALALAVGLYVGGPWIMGAMTTITSVYEPALSYLPYTAIYVALSFAAFQLDGVFVGATRSREMRNTAILSTLLLIGLSLFALPRWGNDGLWLSFIAFVVIRGISLGAFLPRLIRDAVAETKVSPAHPR